jgi:hypothetical protein
MKYLLTTAALLAALLACMVYLRGAPVPLQQSMQPRQSVSAAVATPVIAALSATPPVITIDTSTIVSFTIPITDPTLIPASVNLLRLGATGAQPTILGQLFDDGTHGDPAAGDHYYTAQFTFDEGSLGQLQFQVSAAFKGVLKRVLSPVLTLPIWPLYSQSGSPLSFAYPTFSSVPFSIDMRTDGSIAYDVPTTDGGPTLPVFIISPQEQNGALALPDWFSQNIDSSGLLMDAGTYTQVTLPDGTDELLLISAPPVDWTGGPVAQAYVMSPDRTQIAIIQTSQDDPIEDYGVSSYQVANAVNMLSQTIHFQ